MFVVLLFRCLLGLENLQKSYVPFKTTLKFTDLEILIYLLCMINHQQKFEFFHLCTNLGKESTCICRATWSSLHIVGSFTSASATSSLSFKWPRFSKSIESLVILYPCFPELKGYVERCFNIQFVFKKPSYLWTVSTICLFKTQKRVELKAIYKDKNDILPLPINVPSWLCLAARTTSFISSHCKKSHQPCFRQKNKTLSSHYSHAYAHVGVIQST